VANRCDGVNPPMVIFGRLFLAGHHASSLFEGNIGNVNIGFFPFGGINDLTFNKF
jgi:hypothetical protein